MKPTILLKLPEGELSIMGGVVAYVSVLGILLFPQGWILENIEAPPLHFAIIAVLLLFMVLYYPRRKIKKINAKYDEQHAALPQQGDWRVLRRCTEPADNEPTVRFIGYQYPLGGQHPAHDKQQWSPSLFDPALYSHGIPRASNAVKYGAATGAIVWLASSIVLFWLPIGGTFQPYYVTMTNRVSPVVVVGSVLAWLVLPRVTTEVWFAPGLIRVVRTRPWRSKDVVMDFAVEPGFVATLRHGRPNKVVWFRRFRDVLKLENERSAIEVSAAGLCPDDFWWAVTSDYRTTPEQMDTFLADGGR